MASALCCYLYRANHHQMYRKANRMRIYHPAILDTGFPISGAPAPLPIIYEPADPAQWQYHVVSIDPREDEPLDESALAALGADGWLLAGILPQPAGSSSARVYYYFVRPAQ